MKKPEPANPLLNIPENFRNYIDEDAIGITAALMLQLPQILDDIYWQLNRLQTELDSLEERTHG